MNLLLLILGSLIFLAPIVVPLFMWQVFKIKESKVYKFMRIARYFYALLIMAVMVINLFKTEMNLLTNENVFEGLGGAAANILIAYLLCKKWKTTEDNHKEHVIA